MTVLVLTLSLLAGCGCRNSRPAETSVPTVAPTLATVPTTESTTVPTTQATEPTTGATIEDGNGPLSTDATNATDESGNDNARNRTRGSGSGITGSIE
ncbi:MAG: hypothetical protein IJE81_04095 [Oscillospiraceae bacterium]|nr:hypothetical protein [Oscillospiraceae bacterium]